MNTTLIWSNLATYSLQVGLVIGLAGFVPTALRLSVPRARLIYWHILLAACLLLPLLRPWRSEVVGGDVQVTMTMLALAPATPTTRHIPWTEIGLAVLAAGIVARLVWLAIGYARLQGYRKRAAPVRVTFPGADSVDFRLSDEVASPVTFGLYDPVILLPERFPQLEAAMRDAIVCHELLHIERRDWSFTIVEELVRAIFWFHPAIWWLLGEIQLAREQAVDHEVVSRTNARDEYVDTLLAIAGARARADLAPAPLFLRKRHLKQRVVSILKEVRMSRTKLFSAMAAGVGLLTLACWFVTATFPLAAAPQTDEAGVSVDLGGAALRHRTPVAYPATARSRGVQGDVSIEVTLDSAGNVSDARVISGPEELRKSALQSVLEWHFDREAGATRRVTISFRSGAPLPAAPQPTLVRQATPAVTMAGRTINRITVTGLSDSARADLLASLPLHQGDPVSTDLLTQATSAVKKFDEHLSFLFSISGEKSVDVRISAPPSESVPVRAQVAPPSSTPPDATTSMSENRITVGGSTQQSKLIRQPRPVYPPEAKEIRLQGVVRMDAVIAKDGTMQELRVVSGHPYVGLPAAIEAVRQWSIVRPC